MISEQLKMISFLIIVMCLQILILFWINLPLLLLFAESRNKITKLLHVPPSNGEYRYMYNVVMLDVTPVSTFPVTRTFS